MGIHFTTFSSMILKQETTFLRIDKIQGILAGVQLGILYICLLSTKLSIKMFIIGFELIAAVGLRNKVC
jgi:hypothetical protein